MPITPYHFGPSGLVGLLFRRWIDPVVLVAANIVVDLEVLAAYFRFSHEWAHRVWHFHTLLIGGVAALLAALLPADEVLGTVVGLLERTRGEIRYRGWLDNERLPGEPGREAWLDAALRGVLDGKTAFAARTPTYGCTITRSLFGSQSSPCCTAH